jgi:hypothetical protein
MIHLQALGQFIVHHPFALLACMIAFMLIGFLWYGVLFMKPWAKMTGMDKLSDKARQKMMLPTMLVSLATAFVQSVVMGRTFEILDMSHWAYPLVIATILWFPFTFMVMWQNYAYTLKPIKLLLIDSGYMLVSMWAMAGILHSAIA